MEASLDHLHGEWVAKLGVRLQLVLTTRLLPVPRNRYRVAITRIVAYGPGVGLWRVDA